MVNIGYGNDKRTRHVLPNGAVCIQRQGVGDSAHALGLGLGLGLGHHPDGEYRVRERQAHKTRAAERSQVVVCIQRQGVGDSAHALGLG